MTSLSEKYWHSVSQKAGCNLSSYDQVFKAIAERAERLVNSAHDEEEMYLEWVGEQLSSLDSVPVPDHSFWLTHPQASGVKVFRHRLGWVEFCYLWFSAGGTIPYHDHSGSNGVMHLFEGSAISTSFDIVDLHSEGMTLQSSANISLEPGQMMSFCQRRNNVHAVEAGENGAYILDVFTRLNADAQCRYLHLQPQRDNGLVKAVWSQEG